MFKLSKIIGLSVLLLITYLIYRYYFFGSIIGSSGSSGSRKHEGFDTSATSDTSSSTSSSTSSDPSTKLREMNDQTLTDIQQLQALEKELYAKMEALSASKKLTQKIKDDTMDNINELSQLRMNLYANLKNNYDNYQINAITTGNTYDEQTTAVAVVEKELKDAKSRLQSMEDDKTNKIRYIGVNTYYGKQYEEHSYVMKILIFTCIPIIILSILSSKGIISANVFAVLFFITVFIGLLFIVKSIFYIYTRDKQNYDRTDWFFNAPSSSSSSSSTTSDTSDPWASKTPGTCIGQECCDQGSTYDSSQNICVVDTTTNARESMTTMDNRGTHYASYEKSDAPISSEGVVDPALNNYVVFDEATKSP